MGSIGKLRALAAVGAGALVVVAGLPAQAAAGHTPPSPARTITKGLDGPYGISVGSGRAVVAEADSGEVTAVNLKSGKQTTLLSGLFSPSGVAETGGKLYVVQGAGAEPGAPPPRYPEASVLVTGRNGGKVKVLADLLKYELKHNPDGQKQFNDKGEPYDALTNPFSMTATPWGLLVADGGANDVLKVNPKTGKVSTYFVPPNPRTPECLKPEAQANPGTIGCDSVPTGVAVLGKHVYVSTLGAEQPGAAVIYKLDGKSGKVLHKWKGFTSLTGIVVTPRGTVYASEVLFGAPAGDPPPGFDPAKVGRITKVDGRKITHSQVTMPTGLRYAGGRLYASSWSIASFLGLQHAGRLVEVNQKAFR